MLKVLTAAEMREVDRLTTERYGIPSILLMENAAHAVARVITEKLGGSVKGKSILILCGKGNNGGDGAALARILWQNGANVHAVLFGLKVKTKGDAFVNFDILQNLAAQSRSSISFYEIENPFECWGVQQKVPKGQWHLVVDALFGTGITRPLEDPLAEVVESLFNVESGGYIGADCLAVSVDIPSGLPSYGSDLIGAPFDADITVTFTAPKPANVLSPAASWNGDLVVAQIGSPQELIESQPSQLYLIEKCDAADWLEATKFTDSSYKNKRGHCLLIAGSESYSGAAVMCGNAAMRSGVGLVTLAVPESCKTEVASRSLPEVIVTPLSEGGDGSVSSESFADSAELLEKADAIAVGCGLSATDKGVEKLVREIVETRKTPVIVDAGALWFFNPPTCIAVDKDRPPLIFTPHEGEFMRLLGTDDKDAIKDRVPAVREFSRKHNVILVLKGERVLIGEPGGKVVVNPTGNSGLGKAGNGDTLTGIIAGFVTQAAAMKIDVFETVVAAVYFAGLAGDIAEKKFGKSVMTASDVRECLTDAFREIQSQA